MWETIYWDNGLDFCPDVLYQSGIPLELQNHAWYFLRSLMVGAVGRFLESPRITRIYTNFLVGFFCGL
jgi:hypothetical protein